jgi:hypothetical protein
VHVVADDRTWRALGDGAGSPWGVVEEVPVAGRTLVVATSGGRR